MRHRSLGLLLVTIFLLTSGIAMALTLSRTRTFPGQQLPNGDNPLPAAGINLPNRASFAEVSLSRDNWPAAGVDVSIELTFDAGQSWVLCARPTHIDHANIDPKTGVIAPGKIGCGWNPDRFNRPDAGRLRIVNPDLSFISDIEVDYYTD